MQRYKNGLSPEIFGFGENGERELLIDGVPHIVSNRRITRGDLFVDNMKVHRCLAADEGGEKGYWCVDENGNKHFQCSCLLVESDKMELDKIKAWMNEQAKKFGVTFYYTLSDCALHLIHIPDVLMKNKELIDEFFVLEKHLNEEGQMRNDEYFLDILIVGVNDDMYPLGDFSYKTEIKI